MSDVIYSIYDAENNLLGVYDESDLEPAVMNLLLEDKEIYVTCGVEKYHYHTIFIPLIIEGQITEEHVQYLKKTQGYIFLWFRSQTPIIPKWVSDSTVNSLKYKLLIYGLYLEDRADFQKQILNKVYKTAKNYGQVDSVAQFAQRFPSEAISDFIFKEIDVNKLWNIYGDCLWWETDYVVNYYGDHDLDKFSTFDKWPDRLLAFRRIKQLDKYDKIETGSKFFTDDMEDILSKNVFFTEDIRLWST